MLNRHDSNDRNGSSPNGAISKIELEDGFWTVGMTPSIALEGLKKNAVFGLVEQHVLSKSAVC